jgi:hypothetical protein
LARGVLFERRMLARVVVLVLASGVLMHASVAHASPLTELAESLEPGEWGELATQEIDAVLSANGASGIRIPYSEDIVWDSATRQLVFLGGDHADLADLVVYGEDSNTWETLERPSWIPGSTMHGYDHSAIDPGRRFVYHRPFADNTVHRWDIDSATWSVLPSPPDNGTSCCDALEFFPDMDGLLWTHHSYGEMWLFSETTQEWSMIDTLPPGNTWQVSEYNPVHHVVAFTIEGTMFRLDPDGTVTDLGALGAPIYDGSGYNGVLTVDPVSGDYIVSTPAGEGDRTWHAFDVMANEWGELPTSPDVDLTNTGMVATPIADYGISLFVYCYGGTPCGVLAYKHAPFDIPPGTTSGTDDGSSEGDDVIDDTATTDTAESSGGATSPDPSGTATTQADGDDSSTDEAGMGDDDSRGCGCSSPRPNRSLAAIVLLFATRRRGRSSP